jgi:hypothetical protein
MDGRSGRIAIRQAVGVAVALALVSVVPVAWSFLQAPNDVERLANEGYITPPVDWQPLPPHEALVLALAAVIPAALVGGTAGGLAWRWRRLAGAAVALLTAWPVAIVVLPLAAAVLGIHLRSGISCFTGCDALLRDDEPLGGPYAFLNYAMLFVLFIPSAIVPGVIAVVVSKFLADWAVRPTIVLVVSLLVLAAVYGFPAAASGPGAVIPYVVLVVGVVIWTIWMDRHDPRPTPAPATVQPPADAPPPAPADPT